MKMPHDEYIKELEDGIIAMDKSMIFIVYSLITFMTAVMLIVGWTYHKELSNKEGAKQSYESIATLEGM